MNDQFPDTSTPAVVYARTARSTPYRRPYVATQVRVYAASHGYTIAREFADTGISGTTLDRPGLRALCEYASSRRVDTCIVGEASAMGRTTPVVFGFLTFLQRCGVHKLVLLDVRNEDRNATELDLDEMVQAVRS